MLAPTVLPWFAIVFAVTAAALRSQVAWQQANTAASPPGRSEHVAALEPGGRVLVFGGIGSSIALDDTWLFGGLTWMPAQPGTRPPARSGHGLVHDLVRGRTVLFGGAAGGAAGTVIMDDTWEWDGVGWLLRAPLHRPPARRYCSLVFDLPTFRTVLFGGSALTSFANDTWQWDGADWTPIATATSPPPRHGAGLAADIARARLVLFGGFSGSGALADTWEYDGQDWLLRQPAVVPPARIFAGFAYDQARQRTVMFAGTSNVFLGDLADTWEWSGSDWLQRQPTGTLPAARRATAMTYDPHRALTVMFGGGVGLLGASRLADTFTYAATSPARWVAYGSGCGGSVGVPTLRPIDGLLPWIGDTWGLDLALLPANAPAFLILGTSRTTWGLTPLPMPLAGFGLQGCTLLVSPDASLFTVAVAQVATWPIAIPANQALLGMTMYAQGAGMDLTANAGGIVLGNALEVTFGGR